MMSFCKKSVHSFLVLTNPLMNLDANIDKPSCKCQGPGGLGLITTTGDISRKPNVLESASVKSSSPPPSPPSFMVKKYPGGIGFIDDIGGGVDGLMSCTESLGFESSDERRADDEIELCSRTRSTSKVKWRKVRERREVKKFPPPISSLNHNGQPSFFLRPARRDGRLELTEVRIDRPKIFRASRQDGRLRLHLVRDEDFDIDEEEDQELEQKQQHELEELEEEEEGKEEEDGIKEKIEEEKEEEARVGDWRFPAVSGEGFRRCHELVTHHHHDHHRYHHNLNVWSQHCVTIR